MPRETDYFPLQRRAGSLSKAELRKLVGTDVFKCSGCGTIYRAKKPGCPRADTRCARARQVPTRRTTG